MAEQADGSDGQKVPETPLVAIGAILIAAAVVGRAVEGAGVKVPVIAGTGRQVAAGLVGVLMLVVGLSSRWLPASPECARTPGVGSDIPHMLAVYLG
jgi:hypothetical protein